jgi:hypothetical protein
VQSKACRTAGRVIGDFCCSLHYTTASDKVSRHVAPCYDFL